MKSHRWLQTKELIAGIMHKQLRKVAELIKTINICTDPTVLALKQLVQLVSAHVPHLFAKCYKYYLQLRALMITNRISLLWITFNPLDLQSFIVFLLAGINLPVFKRAALAFKTAIATMNLVAIATFFDETCKAIFNHLFATGSGESRLFGLVLTDFGTVETNWRGMLHLHCLFWLKSMTNLSNF